MSLRSWTLMAAVLFLGLLAGCNPNPQPAGLTPIPTLAPGATTTLLPVIQSPLVASPPAGGAAVAADGASVYFRNCSLCHGAQGEGDIGPALRDNQFIQTGGDPSIFQTIANGRPGTAMPAWLVTNGGPLTNQEITNVVGFLHSLQGLAALPSATPLPVEATETPLPPGAPTPEPAIPSNPGPVGPAASLSGDAGRGQVLFGQICAGCHGPEGVQGIPNPGSDDGSVPVLNPIDPTIANADLKKFAGNLDLFVQHGSVPSGPSPEIAMPAFGDQKLLTEQQIADLIAYVISLNSIK